jgi:cobalt/nickel transport system permease protein
MHVPDGFINAAASAGAAVVSVGGLATSLKVGAARMREKQIPFAGLSAAVIFALQMLNFPVAAGTSGHLLGGALAAILLGPAMGVVVVSVVVIVQALLFADGGVTALGVNVLNMAIITALIAWPIFRGLVRVLPKSTGSAIGAAAVAAWASVVASAMGFTALYAIGGQGGADLGTVFAAMVGVHALIGIGEGLITATAVGAVLAARPDLVSGVSDLELASTTTAPSRRAAGAFVGVGMAVALALVVFVAPLASSSPDGLEYVAEQTGIVETAEDGPIGGPLADYQVSGVESESAGTALSGVVGVGVTFGVGLGLLAIFQRRRVSA